MGFLSRLLNKNKPEESSPAPPENLPERNAPCWCGSGQKYKKCHMDEDRLYLARQREKAEAAKKSCSPVFG